jgi:predicted flap endonuclease-1-like 5' DNA nuclease
MTLVEKLKSILGLGSTTTEQRESVPVEREETDAESERSVKESAGSSETEPADTTESTAAHSEADEDEAAADETAASDAADESTPDGPSGQSVDTIKGIGPAYADRLSALGIETVADLADAEPDYVAEETDISIGRVSNWIERARNR